MRLFNQSIPLQAVIILAVMAVLWWRALAEPVAMTASDGAVLYGIVARLFTTIPLAATITAMLLILVEGLMLNLTLSDHGLTPSNSLLPTLLYVVAMSAPATTLTPMVLAAAAIIGCIRCTMLKGPLLTISVERACTTTALIGLASLFYLPAALMTVGYLLVAINYRLYSRKDWAVLFLGFLAPYALLTIVLTLTDGLAEWWQGVVAAICDIHVGTGAFTTMQAIGNAVLLAVMLAGVVNVWILSGERTVVWQKNATTILAFLVGAIGMLFVTRLFPADMQTFAPSFAFCVTSMLAPPAHTSRYRKRKEWIYITLLILTILTPLIC